MSKNKEKVEPNLIEISSSWCGFDRKSFSEWLMGVLKQIALNESVGHCTTLATPWGRFELIFSETADEVDEACEL